MLHNIYIILLTSNEVSVNGLYKTARYSLKGPGTVCCSPVLKVCAVLANIKYPANGNGTLVHIKVNCRFQSCQPSLVNNIAEFNGKILN